MPRSGAARLAFGLGWFSIGLGLVEILAPREVARWIGAKGSARAVATLRAIGVREVISGVGLLTRTDEPKWLWSRLGGDIIDLALLKTELVSVESDRTRGIAATAAVLGVAAIDGLAALELSREESANHANQAVYVTAAITINRPPDEVYRFWHNLENLPHVLSHLESVRVEGERSHWRAKLPPGLSVEWSAQLEQDVPNELISWRSLPGGVLQNHGRVRFTPAPGGRGTELHVSLAFEALGGALGAAFAKLWGSLPTDQLRADLKRFKQVMETGSVMRSDASVHKGPHAARPSARRIAEGK
ncbi:MAG TPA: SRPBCC family protein [Polyangiaceae bacterium]|nr:SRPBCC family protein [Polyangiaceae bacterium]